MPKRGFKLKAGLAIAMAIMVAALLAPGGASAACRTGGLTPAAIDICTPTAKAKLLAGGELIAPVSAPPRVKAVIAAANKIRTKPYVWGGGHASFASSGYDCSGSVSFALHGGRFLESPLPSGPMMTWGEEGSGRWITVYANAGHAYMTVAGYRFDTSGDEGEETGPRWHTELRTNEGFVARHPTGF
ncbi:MAG: C40 family peptidase [Actinobacteria bacterium]|nr:C40 family peptidase [Actinomycetota bacterium]